IEGGVGVGLASAISPTYRSEIAPADIRGRLISFNQFAIIFGMLVVYFVNCGIAYGKAIEWINETGWRMMFISEAIPAAFFLVLLLFVPETPRFLVMKNSNEKALGVLKKINTNDANARNIFNQIKESISRASTNKSVLSYGRKVIIIGVLLSVFQQFVGINVALYYAPRIRSEEHTSELQSRFDIVCRLL